MKYLSHHILCILIVTTGLQGQTNSPIGITFGITQYQITEVLPVHANTGAISDDLSFFYEHFRQQDYTKYRSFYYQNSCIASEEEFKKWIAHIHTTEVTPIARYLINNSKDTFSIIAYSISSSTGKQYFPLALQRKENHWYLLNIRQSEATMNMKMFFALVNPPFIEAFFQKPEEMKEKYMSSIFTGKGQLNGDLLMNYYESRYDPSAQRHDMVKEVFHDIADYTQASLQSRISEILLIANEYSIPPDKQTILQNMCAGGNHNMALAKIAEWSGTSDIIEITDKFHSGLQKAAKNN